MTFDATAYTAKERFIITDLVAALLPPDQPFVVLDAGARDALGDPRWRAMGANGFVIHGFEIDTDDCGRLNAIAQAKGMKARYHPSALGAGPGTRPFHLLRNREASSFFPPNMPLVTRWRYGADTPIGEQMVVDEVFDVPVTSVDHMRAEGSLPPVDFMKLNVQGGELEILEGSRHSIGETLGLQIELSFAQTYRDAPLFADIDVWLRNQGFFFFDFLSRNIAGRTNSGLRFMPDQGAVWRWPSWQVFEGHFLYLRDPIAREADMPRSRVLKLAAFAEMWGQVEYAFELLEWADRQQSTADGDGTIRRLIEDAVLRYRICFPEMLFPSERSPGATGPEASAASPIIHRQRFAMEPRHSDKVVIEALRELVAAHPPARRPLALADIGCGSGTLLQHLRHSGLPFELSGYDRDPIAIADARRDPSLDGVALDVADVLDESWTPVCDVAVVSILLLGMDDQELERALRVIHRGIRPGGALVMFDLLHPGVQDLVIQETTSTTAAPVVLRIRSMPRMEAALRRAGFDGIEFRAFELPVDFPAPTDPGDIRTHTVKTIDGRRLSFRGALYQPWCHVFARRP